MNKPTPFYIKAFDGLRGIFVPPVLMTHLGCFDFLHDGSPWQHRLWMIVSGHTALYGFFCLSGFLITTILLKEKTQKGRVSIKNFLIRRALRLFPPLVFFYTTIFILMQQQILVPNHVALLCSVFYCYNFIPNKFWSNELSHTWSLSVEEQFYFLWPWVIQFLHRNKIYIATAVIALLSAIAIFVYPSIHFNMGGKMYFLTKAFNTSRWIIPAIFPVLAGSCVALLYFYNRDWVIKFSDTKIIFALMFILLCCPMYLPLALLEHSMLLQSFALCILIIYVVTHPSGKLATLLSFAPVVLIGKMSYAIYIWQGLFLGTGPLNLHWFQQFPQNIILTMLVAAASFFIIEKPLMRYKTKFG